MHAHQQNLATAAGARDQLDAKCRRYVPIVEALLEEIVGDPPPDRELREDELAGLLLMAQHYILGDLERQFRGLIAESERA